VDGLGGLVLHGDVEGGFGGRHVGDDAAAREEGEEDEGREGCGLHG
jgi:hypothetical protein